jgi:hypothetical protein
MKSLILTSLMFLSVIAKADDLFNVTEAICNARISQGLEVQAVQVVVQQGFPSQQESIRVYLNGKINTNEVVTRIHTVSGYSDAPTLLTYQGDSAKLVITESGRNMTNVLMVYGRNIGANFSCDLFVKILNPLEHN